MANLFVRKNADMDISRVDNRKTIEGDRVMGRISMWITLLRVGYPYRRAWVMAGELAAELRGAS